MNQQNPIFNELEIIAPTLINVPRTYLYSLQDGYFENLATNILNKIKANAQLANDFPVIETEIILTPYIVPKNYFESFADKILLKIKVEKIDSTELIPISPINPYQVSSDYFNNLSNQILQKISILDKTEDIFIHSFNRITPYQVPFGYFNTLSNQILGKVEKLDIEELISNINFTKINPYKVPAGYFEGLANEIFFKISSFTSQSIPEGYFDSLPTILLQKIRSLEVESELEEIAPILNSINKKPINHVPAGYFEVLEPVLPQVKVLPAKVIGINKKTNWFKNAIAACLIGTLGFTAYQLMDNAKPITTIQTASNEEIEIKIPTADINVDEELSKVDDTSLTKYLDNIEMPSEQATVHFNEVNSGDVDAALQDISDEAIQQHLDETGGLSNKKN